MKVSFGIIGCGNISSKFADAVLKVDNAVLKAVAASDINRAASFSEKFGSEKSYGSYDELIADSEIDIIYIGLTNQLHFEITKKCLEAGKNVLCEKPLTLTYNETKELIELAKGKNLLLTEALWTRCLPAYKKAKEWATNRIGKIKIIKADFCIDVPYDDNHRLYNNENGGGALYDVGIYPITFVTGILSKKPVEINGSAYIGRSGVDEYSALTMKFDNGEIGVMTSGISVMLPQDAFIYGDQGSILVKQFYGSRDCFLYSKSGELVDEFHDEIENGFIHEVSHVIDLLLRGKTESDLIPFEDTLYSSELFSKCMSEWKSKKAE